MDMNDPEPLPLCGLGIHISPHFIHALVLDLEIPHGSLISDKEKPVLDILAVFASAHPTIICQQNGRLIILIQNITFNCITLRLHEILTPHHHSKNVFNIYKLHFS